MRYTFKVIDPNPPHIILLWSKNNSVAAANALPRNATHCEYRDTAEEVEKLIIDTFMRFLTYGYAYVVIDENNIVYSVIKCIPAKGLSPIITDSQKGITFEAYYYSLFTDKKINNQQTAPQKCTCSKHQIFNFGCNCGGI